MVRTRENASRSAANALTSTSVAASLHHAGHDVLDHLLEGCQVISFDNRYVYVNEAACRHGRLCREQLVGRTMSECYPGIEETDVFRRIRQCMEDRRSHRMENRFEHLDGSVGWFELRMVPVPAGVCVLSIDITDRKAAERALLASEQQLRQAHKLQAVGRLAGGVAHDFNNILSAIVSYAHVVEFDARTPPGLKGFLSEIRVAAERAGDLTRQLLAYSRQQVLQPRSLDLRTILEGMKPMLQRLLRSDVRLMLRCPPSLSRVWADPSQLEQIVLNLAVNAREAMPEGGELTLETADVELDPGRAALLETEPGAYVLLRSTDTGTGFDEETATQIFDPFFTTKASSGGSGLGLSTVYGIVKQSGGAISARGAPGSGAVFEVFLPRADADVEARRPSERPVAPEGGSETILLVEDDPQVSTATANVLRQRGYEVFTVSDAEGALAVAGAHEGLDLLLTDVILPGVDGVELARRVRAVRPEIAIVLLSGYTADESLRDDMVASGAVFLQKPVAPPILLRTLRECLK